MILTKFIVDLINHLLATDNSIWGSIAPNSILRPVANNFVPDPGLQVSDLTFGSFTGSTPILIPIPPQLEVVDNLSGRVGILLNEPIGGYKFLCTVTPPAPEVIYGWAITDSGGTQLYATDLLPTPVTISESGNFVEFTAVLAYLQNIPYGNLPAV